MLSANIKIQTHVQTIRDHLKTNPAALKLLVPKLLFLFTYVLFAVYLAIRGWQAYGSTMFLPLYIVLSCVIAGVLPIAAYLLDQGNEMRIPIRIVAYAGFYWTAFFIYAVFTMTAIDLLRYLGILFGGRYWPQFLTGNRQLAVLMTISFSLLLMAIGTYLARRPRITGYLIRTGKPTGRVRPLRIALLSDIHYGSTVSTANLSRMVRQIESQHPDLILLGGDLIDNSLDILHKTDFIDQMARLRAPLGVFAVLGNHELINVGELESVSFLRAAGIRVLLDESVDIGGQLILAGRRESTTGLSAPLSQMTPEELLCDVNRKKTVIVLQHQPSDLDRLAEAGADLALAGHTHGGQMFPLNLLNKRQYSQTAPYRRNGRLHSIISDGYGTWGPPVRLGSRAEIVVIDLA